MKEGDVYINLDDGRKNIKLKESSSSSDGFGTAIPNGTVVTIVQPTTIESGHVLVSVDEQRGYIQIKHLKVAMNVLNGTPVMSRAYIPPVEVKADVPLLAPPQRQQQQQYVPPQQQYVPPPERYTDPITGKDYAVGPDGITYWLKGGSRRRKQRSSKKRLQKSRTRSKRSRK
jgi:hypothetical protein